MTDSDTLEFESESKPNYEHPLDEGGDIGDNVYHVNLVAGFGGVYHSAPFPVVVTVTDGNDPGSIAISPADPLVGQTLTATLSDEDGIISVAPFLWRAVEPGARAHETQPSETATYVVSQSAVGKYIEAFATYTDRHGGQRAKGRTSEVVGPNKPGAPGQLQATAGVEQVALSWTAADSNGAWITSYQYQRSTDNGNTWWSPDWREIPGSGAATTTYTETELSSDTTYTFEVRAVNAVGEGPASNRDSAQPRRPGSCVLSLSGPASVDYAENGTDAVGTYAVTRSSDCNPTLALSWSRAGDDSSAFQLQGSGSSRSLRFKATPNYKHPLDEGGDNIYDVELQVTDGSASGSRPVAVTVTDANDPGMITISPASPRVGETLRATLTDEDDVLSAAPFNWRALEPGARAHEPQESETATYVASQSAVGKHIEAYTTYTDRHGGQRAKGRTAGVVRPNKPGAPGDLRATAGDEQVTLRWTAADSNGAWITSYQYRWRLTMPPDWSSWASAGAGLSHTVEDLTNGRTHTFEVRARNRVGEGPASNPASATPRGCELSLSGPGSVDYAENGTGSVGTYTATATNCDGLTWSLSGTDDGAFELTGSGSSRTLAFDDPPNYEVKSSYAVIVEVASGSESDSRTVTVNVEDVNEPPVISGPASKSVPENTTPVATYTATDPEGRSVTWTMAAGGGTFSIGGSSGALAFKSAKNYEALSSYTFTGTIRATDSGSASSTQAVTVTVTNVDEPGTVTLSDSSPHVGDQLTATLTDPDQGIRQPTWSWTSGGTAARSSSVQSLRYTVPVGDFGKILKASVGYTDNHGPGKSASRTSSALVGAHRPDPPPDFDAARGDGQVVLTWGPADGNGAPITGYGYRYRSDTGSWPSRFTSISGRTVTISLTNGTLYHFQVEARNIGGASSPSEDSATPAGTPGAPQSLATDRQGGNGFMELTWEAAAANGSAILHYYYRYKKTGDEDWRGWYRRTGGANARSKSWTNFDDGSAYVFQVRARNGVGYGTTAQISASALGPGASRGDRGEHEETEDELMPEGEVPEPGEDDVVIFAKPVGEGAEASWLAGADSLAVRPGPNPFNPETTLRFQLPAAAPVTLTIHNTAGQRVVELIRGEVLTAGLHERVWSGTDQSDRPVASGLYLYRLVAGDQVRVGKLALIR